ncbi:Secretory immunoglobulin A-binding protein EsiB [Massilia sp. Bi118]|uniref:tetratricopeptide repeat protein n=1 Tax=Massilia sp. Bi118 TaxID=2822346 RepID=UPI001E14E6D3|nr:tetratricopeptide repeat protein [Massilia sp. Bi118]CAH0274772.1 Secretory immunoglobulin A-binding protein EsiB [Massilia sp. Bi118]
MKKQIAATMLWLGLHASSLAGLAEGVLAYKEQHYAAALKEIAPLARAGNADAEHLLGLMYYMGHGLPRDYKQAFRWHRKAALQGLPAAEYVVGAMYYTGNAVPQDQALAVSWFRKAAGQGHPDAQYALGLMYRYHVAGLPEDAVLAYMLWDLAAARGHRNAGEQRADIARRMTEAQIEEAQRLSRNWQPGMPLPSRPHKSSSTS